MMDFLEQTILVLTEWSLALLLQQYNQKDEAVQGKAQV